MITTGKCQSCRCHGSSGFSLFLAHPPAVDTMTELSSLNIERDLSPPIINLCLPPWALCPCSKVSHMQTHSCAHTHPHITTYTSTGLLPVKVLYCTTCGTWKKDERNGWPGAWLSAPFPYRPALPRDNPSHWGSQEFTAGAEDIGQDRTGAAKRTESTAREVRDRRAKEQREKQLNITIHNILKPTYIYIYMSHKPCISFYLVSIPLTLLFFPLPFWRG